MSAITASEADPEPKLSIARRLTFPHHRAGWAYSLDALEPLLAPSGIALDPFLEATFCWDLEANQRSGVLPYREPWVGFLHNPPGIPKWHDYESAPQCLFELPLWRESLPSCRGIFTFSEAMAAWVRDRLPIPVASVIHPSQSAECFSWHGFLDNPAQRLIQVGAWLRRMHAICFLELKSFRKSLLSPRRNEEQFLEQLLAREAANDPIVCNADWSGVEMLAYQNGEEYDGLLTRNIVFLDLYDTVVNNTVIECALRKTPLVCRRQPAIEELLGSTYPLYFDTWMEASVKIENLTLLKQAHEHLSLIDPAIFSPAAFRHAIASSEIYKNLSR